MTLSSLFQMMTPGKDMGEAKLIHKPVLRSQEYIEVGANLSITPKPLGARGIADKLQVRMGIFARVTNAFTQTLRDRKLAKTVGFI